MKDNKKEESKKRLPAFLVDNSALKEMFNGNNKGKAIELLKKCKEFNDLGKKIIMVTSLSNFLRAIWLANPDAKINDIQKVLSFLEVRPSMNDCLDPQMFKSENKTIDDTLRIAKMMSGGKNS